MTILEARRCAWCGELLPPWKLATAATCSQRCRQAKQRFRVGAAGATHGRRMRFAYADPPYPELARRYYDHDEVNHAELIARLVRDFPDGWALSTSSKALRLVLSLVPHDVTVDVAVWVNGSRPGVRAHQARDAYEVVLIAGGRPLELGAKDALDNVLVWHRNARQRTHPGALIGMKPAAFCEWLFRMLGAEPGDELVDMFPGSGAVSRAWSMFTQIGPMSNATKPSRFAGAMGDVDARRR